MLCVSELSNFSYHLLIVVTLFAHAEIGRHCD